MSKPLQKFSDYCSDREGAAVLGVSIETYQTLARRPGFPVAFCVGPLTLRRRDALEEIARQRKAKWRK